MDFRCASGHQRVLRSEGHHADVGAVASGVCCGRVVVEFRFVLCFVCCADLTVLYLCVDVDWDMERTTGQYTLRSLCFADRKLEWDYPKYVLSSLSLCVVLISFVNCLFN